MKKQTADTEKKKAILDATLKLITEHGFHAAPMALVAERAGVAAGTIYHHFRSKEDIINALYAQLKEEMGRALLKGDKPGDTYKARFFRFWINLYTHFAKHPSEFLFLEQYTNSPYVTTVTKEENARFYQHVISFLEQGVKTGVLRKMDTALLVALVYGNVVTCVKLQLSGGLKMNTTRIQQAAQATWDAVKID